MGYYFSLWKITTCGRRMRAPEVRNFRVSQAQIVNHLALGTRSMAADGLGDDRAAFRRFDVDGSDSIDSSELQQALEAAGLHIDAAQCSYMLRKYDADRNGTIELQEFVEMASDLRKSTVSIQERLSLRTHPHVQAALDLWWGAAMRSIEQEAGGGEAEPKLRHEPYIAIIKKIFKAMCDSYDEDEATATAEVRNLALL